MCATSIYTQQHAYHTHIRTCTLYTHTICLNWSRDSNGNFLIAKNYHNQWIYYGCIGWHVGWFNVCLVTKIWIHRTWDIFVILLHTHSASHRMKIGIADERDIVVLDFFCCYCSVHSVVELLLLFFPHSNMSMNSFESLLFHLRLPWSNFERSDAIASNLNFVPNDARSFPFCYNTQKYWIL